MLVLNIILLKRLIFLTYNDWLNKVIAADVADTTRRLRFGQRYFNALPSEIANVLRATPLDPFYYDDILPETSEKVMSLWSDEMTWNE